MNEKTFISSYSERRLDLSKTACESKENPYATNITFSFQHWLKRTLQIAFKNRDLI